MFEYLFPQLYVNNAAYVYNEETGEIEMLSQVDSMEDLQVSYAIPYRTILYLTVP